MQNKLDWSFNKSAVRSAASPSNRFLSPGEVEKVRNFHKTFSMYSETPLADLRNLAGYLGVEGIYVKDESYRFGLNAFKVLGGSYAIGSRLAAKLGKKIEEVTFDMLKSEEIKKKLGDITFTTATDGNHGRGIAWTAQQLGYKSVIYMPKGTTARRVENIKETGAEVYVTDCNYDDTVRLVLENSKKYGWEIFQDTAWEGYEEIPGYIMQGYTTMAIEALEQLGKLGVKRPTHIFIQAGVGALAGAIIGFFASYFGDERPVMAVVEPDKADCFLRSVRSADGMPRCVTGDMDTIMAGLACGEPNPIAWEILKEYSDAFVSVTDSVAARGMRVLGNPLNGDKRVVSGESGAVTLGLLSVLLQDKYHQELKDALKIGKDSRILLFSTEGDTDPEVYRRVVWEGAYSG